MSDAIKSKIVKCIIQENGIIRIENNGILIARLVNDVSYDSIDCAKSVSIDDGIDDKKWEENAKAIGKSELEEFEKCVKETNMIQTPEPDYYIHIGIKDDKVIRVNWEEMMKKYNLGSGPITEKIIIKDVRRFLKEARRMLKPNIKEKSQEDIIEELLIKAKEK